MADTETIREFLVQLGFKIDAGSERRFVDSIGAATVKAVALGTAATAAAGAVVAGVARIADNLEQLYFASKRTNAAVENLQATGFAAKQMGVDAATAFGSVESLARFLRNSPGGEGLLKNLGIDTRDARGAMRDTVDLLGDLGKKFADMPYYKAHAFAQALGIDEKTLMAMREGMGEFQQQYKDMLHAAGVDSQQAAKGSHEFMVELRLLGAAFGVLEQKVASSLTGGLTVGIRRVREGLVANFKWIVPAIGAVLDVVGRVLGAVGALAYRIGQGIHAVVEWFADLTPAGKVFIETLGAILAAWRAIGIAMALSPLGIVIALATALVALWDDYQTWKEGGKSLIDWSAWAPGIEAAIDGLKTIAGILRDVLDCAGQLENFLAAGIEGMAGAIGDAASTLGKTIRQRFVDALDLAGAIRRQVDAVRALLPWHASAPAPAVPNKQAPAVPSTQAGRHGSGTVRYPATAPSSGPETVVSHAGPSSSDPRGIRNNNPGNINFGAWARAHGATGVEAGPGGRFATFGNAQAGLDALADLLRSYMARGIDTVAAIIAKYAPAKDHNNTAAYVASVAKRLGVDPNAHLDPRNLQQMAGIMDGIVRVENGKNPYAAEMVQRAAARGVGITQETHITVHGANDPQGVAQATASAQNNVNGQLVRNLRGAVVQ